MNQGDGAIFVAGLVVGLGVAALIAFAAEGGPSKSHALRSAQSCVRTAATMAELQNCRRYFGEDFK